MKNSNMAELLEKGVSNPLVFLTFSFILSVFLYKWLFPDLSHRKNLPPSPPKLPIIGNLHQIGKHPHRSFQKLSQKYGGLVLLHLGTKPTLIISSKEMATLALKTHDKTFCGRPKLAIAKDLFSNGKDLLFSPYTENWRSMRSITVLHLLGKKMVNSFREAREEEVALLIQKIRESKVVNLSQMFFLFTNHIVCRATFGKQCDGDENSKDFDKLLASTLKMLENNNIEDVLPWMGWINRFNGVKAHVDEVSKRLKNTMKTVVEEHVNRAKKIQQDSEKNETPMKDFVDILLQYHNNNDGNMNTKPLDKETIESLILDMFAAGTHTNYVTYEWTFTEIMRHPRVMKRLQEEVRSVVGSKKGVVEEDIEKMSYLKAVIKEGLRFHIPVPLPIPRECTEDVKLNGYDIAAGTQVLFNLWAIGRDPAYWEKPEEFIPERFLNSSLDFKGQHFEFLPFGAGRRGCPGLSFSIAALELALANLVYWFDWDLPDGAEKESIDISESNGTFPHKKTPLVVVATPWMAE